MLLDHWPCITIRTNQHHTSCGPCPGSACFVLALGTVSSLNQSSNARGAGALVGEAERTFMAESSLAWVSGNPLGGAALGAPNPGVLAAQIVGGVMLKAQK